MEYRVRNSRFIVAGLIAGVLVSLSFLSVNDPLLSGQAHARSTPKVDLGIADDQTYNRPNSWSSLQSTDSQETLLAGGFSAPSSRPGLSIAWRNAAQIEEVEVRVQNLGTEPGEGRLWVDVIDSTGKLLIHLQPPDDQKIVRVPAADRGGREGKIIRMKASRDLNNLIDRYDRANITYGVQATIETIGPDANPFDNVKTKSWIHDYGVKPGFMRTYNYVFANHTDAPEAVRWNFEHTPYPDSWMIEGAPVDDGEFVIKPGQKIVGSLRMQAPNEIEEGAFVEARLSLVKQRDGMVFQQHEWFQVYDTVPPTVSNYTVVFTEDHRVAVQALVADEGSGVLEATGVSSEYSTDGGRTWSMRAHNYKTGNFTLPTLFEAILGPFDQGLELQVRFTARDTAGNVTSRIPVDALAMVAPGDANALIESAYIFPRTDPNPIFSLQPGVVDLTAAERGEVRMLATEDQKAVEIPASTRRTAAVVSVVPLERISSPGEELLDMTTLRVTVR